MKVRKQLEILMRDNYKWFNQSEQNSFGYYNYMKNLTGLNVTYKTLFNQNYISIILENETNKRLSSNFIRESNL